MAYATDAYAEPSVRVAFTFPAGSHEPIVYPAAVLASSAHPTEDEAFLQLCASPEGRAIFSAAAFVWPPR